MDNNTNYQGQGFGNSNSGYQTNYHNNPNYQQQNQQYNSGGNYNAHTPIKLPNSGAVLTLGILSIVSLCCCGPTLGPILAIIAIALIPGINRSLKNNPGIFSSGSISNYKAGKICAIIGLCLGVIWFIFLMIGIIFDTAFNQELMDAFNEVWNEMNY